MGRGLFAHRLSHIFKSCCGFFQLGGQIYFDGFDVGLRQVAAFAQAADLIF